MQVNFDAPITDLKGEPLKDGENVVTLASVACTALMAAFPDEQNLDAKAKITRFNLAMLVVDGGVCEVKTEELAELKKVLGRAFGPLVVGRAFEIIESASVTKE